MTFRIELPGVLTAAATRNALIIALPVDKVPAAAGYGDVHFTVPWNGKRFRPHVTFRNQSTRREDRLDVLDIPFEEFLGAMTAINHALLMRWWSLQEHMSVERLADERWYVVDPDLDAIPALSKHLRMTASRIRLTTSIEALLEDIESLLFDVDEWLHPSELPDHPKLRAPTCAFQLSDDGDLTDMALLSYFTRPLIVGQPPGWYMMRVRNDSLRTAIQVVVRKTAPFVFDAMDRAAQAMGLPTRDIAG